ncbi:MAG: dihydropteroate synthase [Chloroflexi bacterium]|nr:MAG: dihydropteroate synthase [Chloroflexota bacterium]
MTESRGRERVIPDERGVERSRPAEGGGRSTPSFRAPAEGRGETFGLPTAPRPLRIRARSFEWGRRTYVVGILNVTPDSFSGDGLLGSDLAGGDLARPPDTRASVESAVSLAQRMAEEGADMLDVGGESSRPGHSEVDPAEERRRVVPVIAAIREKLGSMPISIDTVKPSVAEAALDAGADVINDVWGVSEDDGLARLAAERGVPLVVMHNRGEARYANLMAEVIADLQRALERALRAGVAWDRLLVDPGFGFGKAPVHNLALLRGLGDLRLLGRPVMLGTSRKSTLGKVLDLPSDQRLEATLATTALGIAAGIDLVRVHDVLPNVRAARISDAVLRGEPTDWLPEGGSS